MNEYRTIYLLLIVFLVILSLVSISGGVSAHSPSDMELSYDRENYELTVTVSHSVGNKNTHYIEEVIIEKNGDEYERETYSSQPDNSEFIYTYSVDASEGDTINVKANCNQGGDIEKTIELTEECVKEKDDTPFIPLSLVILVVAITSLIYKKK